MLMKSPKMSSPQTQLCVVVQNVVEAKPLPTKNQIVAAIKMALPVTLKKAEVTVRIVGREESQGLNRRYRHQDKATNILSFNYHELNEQEEQSYLLGDLVICAAVVEQEAMEQQKELLAHWQHLLVHGTLHLLGYDHEHAGDAARMEQHEIILLSRLGISNPYC
jgi:probable rRNA maturation factor